MYALIIVLNAVSYLDDVLAGFVKIGISGATVLDSQGMGSVIVNSEYTNIPLFKSLNKLLSDSEPYSKTIFTVLKNQELVDKAVAAVQESLDDISSSGIGFMFTVPIGNVYKINPED